MKRIERIESEHLNEKHTNSDLGADHIEVQGALETQARLLKNAYRSADYNIYLKQNTNVYVVFYCNLCMSNTVNLNFQLASIIGHLHFKHCTYSRKLHFKHIFHV